MDSVPESVRHVLRRLARRLALGMFLSVWPAWAAAGLLAGGLVALACRLFFPAASARLPWLWLAPVLALLPALVLCFRRAYRPAEIAALADSLGGGHGFLLTLVERHDPAWAASSLVEQSARAAMPRLRVWRSLAPVVPAAAFLAAALWLPQRTPSSAGGVLADEIARDLTATVSKLKEQELVTPDEEQKLQEEIERIRQDARERIDPSSWEAADALREKMLAEVSRKQDAISWAQESLRRYAAAAEGGAGSAADTGAAAAELADAIDKLAKSGLLAGAPPELQKMLAGGKLPKDAQSLRELTASLAEYLGDADGKLGKVAALGKEFGRFNPEDFPLDSAGPGENGEPGRGGIDRGRADAALTWGKESLPLDRFKAEALPPGAARNPDEWAPIVELPGAPTEAVQSSTRSAARQYAGSAGQAAWRRTLAPRHQSAVKKYFGGQAIDR